MGTWDGQLPGGRGSNQYGKKPPELRPTPPPAAGTHGRINATAASQAFKAPGELHSPKVVTGPGRAAIAEQACAILQGAGLRGAAGTGTIRFARKGNKTTRAAERNTVIRYAEQNGLRITIAPGFRSDRYELSGNAAAIKQLHDIVLSSR